MLVPIPYARHCYARFADGTTSSFSNDGVNPDADPNNPGTVCTDAESVEKDSCIRQAMQRCLGSNYHFIRFNCCHCVEQALTECGTSVPPSEWPNWPVNPGPQPEADIRRCRSMTRPLGDELNYLGSMGSVCC
jgi:hypothetical protein